MIRTHYGRREIIFGFSILFSRQNMRASDNRTALYPCGMTLPYKFMMIVPCNYTSINTKF